MITTRTAAVFILAVFAGVWFAMIASSTPAEKPTDLPPYKIAPTVTITAKP